MRVHVHAARQDQQPRRVDLPPARSQGWLDRGDAAAVDSDVGPDGVGGGDDGPPAHHQLVIHDGSANP